jgi:hypothetical protein
MEWVLQSLTSWSRLRECRAGELNNICVVSDESMVKGGLDSDTINEDRDMVM